MCPFKILAASLNAGLKEGILKNRHIKFPQISFWTNSYNSTKSPFHLTGRFYLSLDEQLLLAGILKQSPKQFYWWTVSLPFHNRSRWRCVCPTYIQASARFESHPNMSKTSTLAKTHCCLLTLYFLHLQHQLQQYKSFWGVVANTWTKLLLLQQSVYPTQ